MMSYTRMDLELADRHILQGERHIVSQERVITRLRELDAPTQLAEELLIEFQLALASHHAHRDQIKADLANRELNYAGW